MSERPNKEEIKKINENLENIKNTITNTYSQLYDDIEERNRRIQRVLESGRLGQGDIDYYLNKKRELYKIYEKCDEEQRDSLGVLNKAIADAEEYYNEKENNDEADEVNDDLENDSNEKRRN